MSNYNNDTPPLEFISDVYDIMKDGDNLPPEKLIADVVGMLKNYLSAQQSAQPTGGNESQNLSVYSHPSCIFNYCPNPDICRKSQGGCIHPASG